MANRQKGAQPTQEQQRTAIAATRRGLPLPEGLTLDSQEERTLWRQFCMARMPQDWRQLDLVVLHKIVKLEVRIRAMWEELDSIGYLLENARGTVTGNPLVVSIHQVQNQQLAMIRTLQLTEAGLAERGAVNKRGKQQEQTSRAMGQGQDDEAMELLAHTDPLSGETLYEPSKH